MCTLSTEHFHLPCTSESDVEHESSSSESEMEVGEMQEQSSSEEDEEATSRTRDHGRGRGTGGRGCGRGTGGRGRGRGTGDCGRGRRIGIRAHGRGTGDCRHIRGAATRGQRRGSTSHTAWKWDESYNNDSSLSSPPVFDENSGPAAYALTWSAPDEFFRLLFPENLVELIVDNTKLYAAQQGFPITFTKNDILGFLGMNIAMGIVGLPEVKDYWAREPILQHPWFPTVMPRDKFLAISRFIHFADNTQAPSRDDSDYDRLWKIRPVIQFVKEQSSKAYVLDKKVNIDESMIGTKSRLAFIQ